MIRTASHPLGHALVAGAATLLIACAGDTPVAPDPAPVIPAQFAAVPAPAQANGAMAALRRATARYHDLDVALADGFEFLHECEERPGAGPVGIVYAHFGRIGDGVIDPSLPDALVYEPGTEGPELVAAELVMPYAFWTGAEPPSFLGATFQPEDEFGVWGLHVWIWRHNPEGMFAQSNPRVSCDAS